MKEAHHLLEGYADDSGVLRRIPLETFPFQVGRKVAHGLTLSSPKISRLHAEIDRRADSLVVRDKGSKNGTFVNRRKIDAETVLEAGDVLQFGEFEFRLVVVESSTPDDESTMEFRGTLPHRVPVGARELRELLMGGTVKALFQPVVEAESGAIHGYEALGRGTHPGLAENPGSLFRIAESTGLAVELSDLFRRAGVATAAEASLELPLFVNTHPEEMADPVLLLEAVAALRRIHPAVTLVLEVHEKAVVDLERVREVRSALKELSVGLAYDDFGAGQARLVELAGVPPDYLKVDAALIRDLDRASAERRALVRMIVQLARELDVRLIGEGVSSADELAACRDLGFELVQGYSVGPPGPLPV